MKSKRKAVDVVEARRHYTQHIALSHSHSHNNESFILASHGKGPGLRKSSCKTER